MVESIYPVGPIAAPESLTQPTRAYKQKAWLAVAGLGGFVADLERCDTSPPEGLSGGRTDESRGIEPVE